MLGIACCLLALAFALYRAGRLEPAVQTNLPAVGVHVVREQPVTLSTELPGRVVAREVSDVRPQVNGVIRQRLFEEGSQVDKGRLLYVVEDVLYRAAVVAAEGRLAEASASIESTRAQARRAASLLLENAISRQEMEATRDAYLRAQAAVLTQRGGLDAARANLEFTRIRAPISGRIGRSFASVGALVQSGQPAALAQITQADEVYVDVSQSADKLLDLRSGEHAGGAGKPDVPAKMRLLLPNGREYPYQGKLRLFEAVVDPGTGSVAMRALFPNPEGTLLPGMAVRAIFFEDTMQRAILAPQQAIVRDAKGGAMALILDRHNRVVARTVVAERAVGNQWLVTKGLAQGERLVVDGLGLAKPGKLVRPVAPQPGVATTPADGEPR